MKIGVFFIFIFISSISFGHAYYFAFGEMQYNNDNERFEVSIRATGHDIEEYMEHLGQGIGKLEVAKDNPIAKQKLEEMLLKHFTISVEDKRLALELVGLEVNVKDEVVFYLVSKKIKEPKIYTIKFDLLMDYFEEQQNKITIFTTEGKEYLSFLPHKTERTFDIKNYD